MPKKLFIILGNQLFPLNHLKSYKSDHIFYMSEDYELCTYEKHHKHKILLFLSAMRSYADRLKKSNYNLIYKKIDEVDFKDLYLKKLEKVITKNKIIELTFFEIEDKPFEKKL